MSDRALPGASSLLPLAPLPPALKHISHQARDPALAVTQVTNAMRFLLSCSLLPLLLPTHQARDPDLAVTQVTNAMRFLPPEAVLAFNIGNEADSYM